MIYIEPYIYINYHILVNGNLLNKININIYQIRVRTYKTFNHHHLIPTTVNISSNIYLPFDPCENEFLQVLNHLNL